MIIRKEFTYYSFPEDSNKYSDKLAEVMEYVNKQGKNLISISEFEQFRREDYGRRFDDHVWVIWHYEAENG